MLIFSSKYFFYICVPVIFIGIALGIFSIYLFVDVTIKTVTGKFVSLFDLT